jgi:hypothetical protein
VGGVRRDGVTVESREFQHSSSLPRQRFSPITENGTFTVADSMDPDDVRAILGEPDHVFVIRVRTEVYDFPESDLRVEATFHNLLTCRVFGVPIYATEVTGWFRVSQLSEPTAQSYWMRNVSEAPEQKVRR